MHNNKKEIVNNLGYTIIENSHELIILLDSKLKIKKLNPVAKKILGVPTKNIIGTSLFTTCKNNRIKLSFTKKDLLETKKSKVETINNGHIIDRSEKQKKEIPISWKLVFLSEPSKANNHFLIIGNDLSETEKYRNEAKLATSYLNSILENLPEYIYWKDTNLIYQGCNKHVADYLGLQSPKEITGKTDRDFGWNKNRVKTIEKIDNKIMKTGIPNIVEDVIPKPDGSERVMLSSKSPLMDGNGNTVGIVGISVDITDYKRAESLLIENKLQKTRLAEAMIFKKTAEQLAHDIRSPLASLSMIVETCKNIPEPERIPLREVAASIDSIANNLLVKYKKYNKEKTSNKEVSNPSIPP